MTIYSKKLTILIFLITTVLFSQKLTKQDWITDISFLKTELSEKHKNLFFKITREDFNKEIEKIIQQLDSDTTIETSIKLTQLIAKIGDTHTNLSISNITRTKNILPLGLTWFKKGIYISSTNKDNYELLDKKLIAINDYKIETIIDSLKTVFVPENIAVIKENTARLIKSKVLLKYFGFSKSNETSYKLTLSNSKGEISEYNLKETPYTRGKKDKFFMKSNSEKPFYINNSRKIFKEKYFPNEKIYFVQYNKCMSSESVTRYGNKEFAYKYPSFKEFETKILNTLANEKIDKLIFDMRFNKGGSSYLAESLIKKIAKNKKINKKGNLFVVVGNKTFSSAIINTIDFKDNTKATIIGEKTGGKANHYGNIKKFSLPYSGIKVTYSTAFYRLNNDTENTVTPDVIIERTYSDFKKGIDPIFEWVKKQ